MMMSNDPLTRHAEQALDAYAARHLPGGKPPTEPDPSGLAGVHIEDDAEGKFLDAYAASHFPGGRPA